jgi:hypothetical protein
LGLENIFLLTLDALDRSINASLGGLERTSIKRGLTNFFSSNLDAILDKTPMAWMEPLQMLVELLYSRCSQVIV